MSRPLPIEPGKTYMLTRRCAARHRWLTPTSKLNALFQYLFAVGAERFGLEVHALVVMSTHYHAVVTDPEGRIPAFEQWLHSLLARAVNQLRKRTDTFWDGRHGGRQEVVDADALRHALVYVWNNPTAAGLVRRGKDWPGVRSTPHHMLAAVGAQKAKTFQRPEDFFDVAGSLPETVELAFSIPAMLLADEQRDDGADADGDANTATDTDTAARLKKLAGRIVGRLNALVCEAEDKVAEAMAEAGRRFVGPRSIQRQSPNVTSKKPEKHGAKQVRVPLFLASSREARDELLAKLADWRQRYRAAREALAVYLTKVASNAEPDLAFFEDQDKPTPPLFPWGTYQLRLRLAVPCHPPPG